MKMRGKSVLRTLSALLLTLGLASAVQAQTYFLADGGGQLAIGNGLMLPIQPVPPCCDGTPGGPTGTGWIAGLPLLIAPVPVTGRPSVMQFGVDPMTITFGTPTLLSKAADGTSVTPTNGIARPVARVGVFLANPMVPEVDTSLSFAFPLSPVSLAPGGRSGAPVVAFTQGVGGAIVTYTAGTAQFGGPAQFTLSPGPGTAAGIVPGAPVTVFIAAGSTPPGVATMALLVGAFPNLGSPPSIFPAGGPLIGPITGTSGTTPGLPGAMSPNVWGIISQTPGGLIPMGLAITAAGGATLVTNAATVTAGFPFTTGKISMMQVSALGMAETFTLTGLDTRVSGVGNISLVAGGIGNRTSSGPNVNRAWLSMDLTAPEPGAILGAAGALSMLVLCHGLVRRRSR